MRGGHHEYERFPMHCQNFKSRLLANREAKKSDVQRTRLQHLQLTRCRDCEQRVRSSRSIRTKIRSPKALGRANTTVRCISSSFATIATPAVGATTKEAAYWLSPPQNRQWPSGPFAILKMPRSLVAS